MTKETSYIFIYYIYSTSTLRGYIGSSIDPSQRFKSHKTSLKNKNHCNKKLQYHVNKYGLEDLKFEIIGKYPIEYRVKIEQFFIDNFVYNSYFNCDKSVKYCAVTKRKFKKEDYLSLVKELKRGDTKVSDLAQKYKVSETTIYNIKKKIKNNIVIEFTDTTQKINYQKQKIDPESYSKLNRDEVLSLIADMNSRLIHPRKLCEKYKISMATYQRIKRGACWKEYQHLINEEVRQEKFRKTPSYIKSIILERYSLFTGKKLNVFLDEVQKEYNVSKSHIRNIINKVY